MRGKYTKCCHSIHILKRSDFHFSGSQRVEAALPVIPPHTVTRRCVVATAVVETVQVGVLTAVVPPATFAPHCKRVAWVRVVVLVSSAELVSKMPSQWITFTQQIEHWHVSLNSTVCLKKVSSGVPKGVQRGQNLPHWLVKKISRSQSHVKFNVMFDVKRQRKMWLFLFLLFIRISAK